MVYHDVAIVGAGVVGLSVSLHLAEDSDLDVAVLDKETHLAAHQSGRNSGVLHPGFNYDPESQKARFAVEGTRRAKAFCAERGVPLEEGGVVVVASDREEERRLDDLAAQAASNGVEARVIDSEELHELEPHARGVAALHAPGAASIDSEAYVQALALAAREAGVARYMNAPVTNVEPTAGGYRLESGVGEVECSYLVNAAGLGADRLAHALDIGTEYQIIPFRGEYRELVPGKRDLCRSMIYPTPDPDLPFLGIHFTRRTDGRVLVGPNAVLALGREAYGRYDVNLRDLVDILGYRGFWRLIAKPQMLRVAGAELHKTYRIQRFVRAAQQLVPELDPADVVDSYAGVRAQLVSADGTLVNDPLFVDGDRSTHVLNAVSPGLTCSLPFGDHLATRVMTRF